MSADPTPPIRNLLPGRSLAGAKTRPLLNHALTSAPTLNSAPLA
jgi:hypothetical protein